MPGNNNVEGTAAAAAAAAMLHEVGSSNAGGAASELNNNNNQTERFEEGRENSHKENDSKDQRSIANRLGAARDQNDPAGGSGKKKTAEQLAAEADPTLPARMHGNEPSRGAKVDKAIEDDEAELLRRMDESKAAKKANK